MRGLEWPLVQVLWLVTSDVDGRSAAAAATIRERLARGLATVREDCFPLPAELTRLRSEVWTATAAPVGARRMGDIEDAFAVWARAIGVRRSPMHGASDLLDRCNELGRQLRAGYALWWDHEPQGKRWWVQIIVENDTAKRYWVDLQGTLWVTGLPRVDRYARHDERGGEELSWGGSSADSMYAEPFGTTTQRVGVGMFSFVHTSSDGVVYGVRPEVLVYVPGGTCSLPVPRMN
jgi:hypothetical protein